MTAKPRRPNHANDVGSVHSRHSDRYGWEKSHHLSGYPDQPAYLGPGPGPGNDAEPGKAEVCPVCTTDTRFYPWDPPETPYSMPVRVPGAGIAATRYSLSASDAEGPTYTSAAATPAYKEWRIASYLGRYSRAHTDPANVCAYFAHMFVGWIENARVFELTIGTIPTGAAGITFDARAQQIGGVLPRTAEVRVLNTQPTSVREGTLLASLPDGGALQEVFIPVEYVTADSTLYVMLGPGWEANKDPDAYVCAYNWPFNTNAENSDWAEVRVDGYSPGGTSAFTWSVWDSTEGSYLIGLTPEWPDWENGGPPFDGEVGLYLGGVLGVPVDFGISGRRMYLTADAPAQVSFYWGRDAADTDDYDVEFPWSNELWAYRYKFTHDVLGSSSEDGLRQILTEQGGVQAIVHLGDTFNDPGISLHTTAGDIFYPYTFAVNTDYEVRVETRAGVARMRVWPTSVLEPAEYLIELALGETSDDDIFAITIGAGNGAANPDQTIYVWGFEAAMPAQEGHWVDEELGFGNASVVDLYTSHRYYPSSLMFRTDGFWVWQRDIDPYAGHFMTDYPPAQDAPLAARYQVAPDVDTGEDDYDDDA